jgi:beta-glucanase (GH16 family)
MLRAAAFLLIAFYLAPALHAQPVAAAKDSRWKPVWSDEFNGDSIDRGKWAFDIGNGFKAEDAGIWVSGWGNNEKEYYTDRKKNVYVKDGMLHIRANKEDFKGCHYTSARLVTRGLFSKAYGRFEFRAKLPVGRGLWPAIWLLPQDNAYGTWASSGEIDLLEARGHQPDRILGTLHYGSHWPGNDYTEADYSLPRGGTVGDFHVYALEWVPGVMRWFVDDHLYSVKRHWWSCSKVDASYHGPKHPPPADINPWPAPFDKPFYLVMNLAVGGNFPGDPDASTVFPQEMLVDYVRVYDKVGGYRAAPPPGKNEGIEKTHPDPLKPARKNLALRKPAAASSEQAPEHLAAMAADGDEGTRWSARDGAAGQWWQVDPEKQSDLTGAELQWEMENRNYRFVVEGSADAKTWQTLSDQSKTDCTWQIQDVKFSAGGIRYVRVRVTGLEPGTWASLAEVRVFGK